MPCAIDDALSEQPSFTHFPYMRQFGIHPMFPGCREVNKF
jgi:hypothetical protein